MSGCQINKVFHSIALAWALKSVLFLVASNPSFHWQFFGNNESELLLNRATWHRTLVRIDFILYGLDTLLILKRKISEITKTNHRWDHTVSGQTFRVRLCKHSWLNDRYNPPIVLVAVFIWNTEVAFLWLAMMKHNVSIQLVRFC